jgi:hypothetical protein
MFGGRTPIVISLSCHGPPKPLWSQFESRSPLHRINLINDLQGLEFQQPGVYAITVEVDDDPILVTSLAMGGPE